MLPDASMFALVAWLGGAAASPTTTTMPSSLASDPTAATKTSTTLSSNTHVSFWYGFPQPTSHVIVVPPGPKAPRPQIGWSVVEGRLNISKASLFVVDSNNTSEKGRLIATSTPTVNRDLENHGSSIGAADSTSGGGEDRKPVPGIILWEKPSEKRWPNMAQPTDLPFGVELNGSGSVTLYPSSYREYDAVAKRMYISLDWYDIETKTKGNSFTTLFAASERDPGTQGTDPLADLVAELAKTDQSIPYQPEGPVNSNPPDTASSGTDTAAQTSSTATTDGGTGVAEGQKPGEGGGGGLNTGAIAGIVVGSVIGGLLIIGALAYFLCFRRRAGGKQQRRHIHGDVGYASDSGAAAMMMREKEMPGVNHSPQSAYADDSGRLHNRGGVGQDNDSISYSNTPTYQEERGVGATGIGTQQQSRDNSLHQNEYNRPQSYAADSAIGVAVSGGAIPNTTAERERNGSVGGGSGAVGRASHQTSRPGSEVRSPSRYAHLIEEGMTEDEIRRLEDEERQLDAAIEDAGRHGRPR